MPFGVLPADYVADIREIARVCREETVPAALEFVEYIQPVKDRRTRGDLEVQLDDLLGGTGDVWPVVPTTVLDEFAQARVFVVAIGGRAADPILHIDTEHIAGRVRRFRSGRRAAALRNGKVTMYADDGCRESLGTTSAAKWIEASASIGSRRFFLLDGDWYEIDAEYARTAHRDCQLVHRRAHARPPTVAARAG